MKITYSYSGLCPINLIEIKSGVHFKFSLVSILTYFRIENTLFRVGRTQREVVGIIHTQEHRNVYPL